VLKRIRIENFMAHADTEIEFAPGVTVLTGPNNIGKSAVVEALRCVVTNPAPRHFIRHDAAQAVVEVELDDGWRVVWTRKPRYALYDVYAPGAEEPERYAKFGRTPPEDVLARLRLSPVAMEESGQAVDVHLGDQREPIFLLDNSGSEVAGFFAASSEAAHLLAMQQLLQARAVRARQDQRAAGERVAAIEADLDRLAPLPDLELALGAAREGTEALARAERELPELAARAADVRRRRAGLALLRRRLAVLAPLRAAPDPADLADTAGPAEALAAGRRLRTALGRAARQAETLAPLAPAPVLAPAAPLAAVCRDLRRLSAARRVGRNRCAALAPLAAPPAARPVRELAATIAALGAQRARCAALGAVAATLAGLAGPPDPAATVGAAAPLATALDGLRDACRRVLAARERLAGLDADLAARRDRIAARLAEIMACPLCGGVLDAESFLSGTHAGLHGPHAGPHAPAASASPDSTNSAPAHSAPASPAPAGSVPKGHDA
jgi:exonuclease SbcC